MRIIDWSSDVCSSDLHGHAQIRWQDPARHRSGRLAPSTRAYAAGWLADHAGDAVQRAGQQFHHLETLALDPARHLQPAVGGTGEAERLVIGLVADQDADAVAEPGGDIETVDRKSTRLNSSH